jgi:hypothetical protein
MKTFIQTHVVADFVMQSNILEKRWWPAWTEPYTSFFYEWAAKGHYTVEPHPEDYRIEFADGTMALGYYWGDESFVAKCAEYIEAKKTLPNQPYILSLTCVTCGDDEHPTQVLSNVLNYSLADDPTKVYTNLV